MRFVTVRDFRSKSAQVWRDLRKEDQMVVTSNGKPVALLTQLSEKGLEETLQTIRKARGLSALMSMQAKSVKRGNDLLTLDEINAEIEAVRGARGG